VDKQFATITENLNSYNDKSQKLAQSCNTRIDPSTLVTMVNECDSINQFESLITQIQEGVMTSNSSGIKETTAELEIVAKSLLNQLKYNPVKGYSNLLDNFKLQLLPKVDNFFEQSRLLNETVESIDSLLLNAETHNKLARAVQNPNVLATNNTQLNLRENNNLIPSNNPTSSNLNLSVGTNPTNANLPNNSMFVRKDLKQNLQFTDNTNKISNNYTFIDESYKATKTENTTIHQYNDKVFINNAPITNDKKFLTLKPPKKPKAPSYHYIMLNRAKCKTKNPNCNAETITKILRDEWAALSEKKSALYFELADKEKEKYRRELKKYEAQGGVLQTINKSQSKSSIQNLGKRAANAIDALCENFDYDDSSDDLTWK